MSKFYPFLKFNHIFLIIELSKIRFFKLKLEKDASKEPNTLKFNEFEFTSLFFSVLMFKIFLALQ